MQTDPSYTDVRTELSAHFAGSVGWGVTWAEPLDLDKDLDLFVADAFRSPTWPRTPSRRG